MGAVLKNLKRGEGILVITLMVAMVLVAFAQVVFRVVLSQPLAWSEEVSRYLFVWIVFVGGAWAVPDNAHFKMDFLSVVVPPRVQRILLGIGCVCMMAFAWVMLLYGWKLLHVVATQMSPATRISMAIPYSALPISGLLILIHSLELIVGEVRGPQVEKKEG